MNPYYEMMKSSITGGGGMNGEDIGKIYRSVYYQRGYGLSNGAHYGMKYGLGFADMMQGFFRIVKPLLNSGAQYLGNQVVNSAANIAKDVIGGQKFKDAAKSELSSAAGELMAKAPEMLSAAIRTTSRKRKGVSTENKSVGSTTAKRLRKAGYYRGRGLLKTYPALEKIW